MAPQDDALAEGAGEPIGSPALSGPPKNKSPQEFHASRMLLAAILDGLVRYRFVDEESERARVKDVWYAAALAAELNYPVFFDAEGRVNIYLPWSLTEQGHVQFWIGISSALSAGKVSAQANAERCKIFYAAVAPGLGAVRPDREEA